MNRRLSTITMSWILGFFADEFGPPWTQPLAGHWEAE